MGSATRSITTSAAAASSAVAGSRAASSCTIGVRLRNDLPKLPVTTLPSQCAYCTGYGSFRPSCSRIASRSADVTREVSALGSAMASRMAWAASPGMRRSRVKTTSDIPTSMGTVAASRSATYLSMA